MTPDSKNPPTGCEAMAATITIHSTLTVNRAVSATTEVFPDRSASRMNTATASQAPNIAAAARMWTNLIARMRMIIAAGRAPGVSLAERDHCV